MDMNNYQYRFDYLRLSTEEKPEPNVDGSTCYEVDTSELYIAYKGQWYKQGANKDEQLENTLNRNIINIPTDLKEINKIIEPIDEREEPEEIIEPIDETDNFEYIEDFEEGEE